MENDPIETKVDMTFTKELRAATKDVHKISDVLVNAKFAFALHDDSVWYDGLLGFYEIFKYFEANLPEELLPKELHRTEAFEKDFVYFYGENWKDNYKIRPAVKEYLANLERVNKTNKLLLFAYAYQMYMGLMSGGQLLQKKRIIAHRLWPGNSDITVEEEENEEGFQSRKDFDDLTKRPMPTQVSVCPDGCAATFFSEKISVLKCKLRTVFNNHYVQFDDKMKADFIEESKNVFILNSNVIRSIKGVNRVTLKYAAIIIGLIAAIYIGNKFARS